MYKIYTIEENKIHEFQVVPNSHMKGWSILEEHLEDGIHIYPVMNEALERNRFDSIKKSETYAGLGNLVYYNSREEVQEVLDLERQYRKK